MPRCDIGSGILSCIVQYRMHKKGYVITHEYKFKKKEKCKPEDIVSDSVDWVHMHNSEACTENLKKLDPKEYISLCKYYKVKP